MSATLDAAVIRRWCDAGLAALIQVQDEINALNVYPVPDGDTGTNLVLTLRAVRDAAQAVETDAVSDLLGAMAHGALMGARGNSGVILSQLIRGFADVLSVAPHPDADLLRRGFRRAADLGYAAVAHPVEGTVLTVARAAADAADATEAADCLLVASAAADAARHALARTPEQLAVLAEAGVVDAGGRGYVVLLDTLVGVLQGNGHRVAPLDGVDLRDAVPAARSATAPSYAYEVQYLLAAPDVRIDELKSRLHQLGDSLAVVGGDGLWNVHVHVDDVGAALQIGREIGEPSRISVARFAED